jgi:hypothetical protein
MPALGGATAPGWCQRGCWHSGGRAAASQRRNQHEASQCQPYPFGFHLRFLLC